MNAAATSVLLTEVAIQQRVAEIGARISADYSGGAVTIVGILRGSFVFVADLIRNIDPAIGVEVDFMTVSSYRGGRVSTGEIRIVTDVELSLDGKDVILVEDIVDTGLTLSRVRDLLTSRGARTIRVATLLEKPASRKYAGPLDYVGFEIPDRFVVGYGMDDAQKYRNLREIRVLDEI